MWEYEIDVLPELAPQLEWEWESDGEWESEEFFGKIAALARRAASSPALRKIGLRAARGALSGLGGVGSALGGALGGAKGSALGKDLGAALGRHVSGWLPQRELEYEEEYEEEWEVNPIRHVYPDALMEHLGHAAAQCESEEEAEAFLGALVPLAARLIPQAASSIMKVAPSLIRGVAGAARTLRSNPATRPLVRTLPTVVRNTTATLAKQARQGHPVTPQSAVRTLAKQTQRVVASPQRATQAFRRSKALDRRFHRLAGPTAAATGPAAGLPAQRCACGRINGAAVQ